METASDSLVQDQLWDVNKVEDRIRQLLNSKNSTLSKICTHLHSAGGKRIRARIMLLTGQILDLPHNQTIEYAAIIELIHMATLMHDDVIDESHLRRHQPSANHLWGNRLSILAGDFLITSGFMALNQQHNFTSQAILAEMTQEMIQAEVDQQLACGNFDLSVTEYLKIIHGKTATLFAAIGKIATHLTANPDHDITQTLTNLGMAFQITDDMLDYACQTQEIGKESARDLAENKMTLPFVLALNAATPTQKAQLQTSMVTAQRHPDQLSACHQQIIDIFHTLKIEQQVRMIAADYCSQAMHGLAQFPPSQIRHELMLICQKLSQRTT